jgi:transposase
VFGEKREKEKEPDIQRMQAKIGQLALENDFLENALIKAGLLSAKR